MRRAIAGALVCAGLAAAGLARAQSVEDYHLPPKEQATPGAQGPVAPDHPAVLGPAPTPVPEIAAPPPSPAAQASPPPIATRPPPVQSEKPPASTAPAERTVEPRSSVPAAPPLSAAPSAGPVPPPAAPVAPATSAPALQPVATGSELPWLLIAGVAAIGLALVVGVIGFLRRRRRPRNVDPFVDLPPIPAIVPEPAPVPPVLAPVPPVPAPAPPVPKPAKGQLIVEIEIERLTLSLVYATARYRLTLRNELGVASGPIRVTADLTSAHASLSADEQLRPDPRLLPQVQALAGLAPLESVTVEGDLRLPLTGIRPIDSPQGRVFVPLARMCVSHADGTELRVLALGQHGSGAALRLISLDQGPRTVRELSSRLAASEHLDADRPGGTIAAAVGA